MNKRQRERYKKRVAKAKFVLETQAKDKALFEFNKAIPTGEEITCRCGETVIKRRLDQAFCNLSSKCKDEYWNMQRRKVKKLA